MNRRLTIGLWNANGVVTRRNELQIFIEEHNLDVILVTETHLQPEVVFNLRSYQTYRMDRPRQGPANPGGGTAVFVSRRVTHRELQVNTNLETTGIALNAGGIEICIFSVYARPGPWFRTDDLEPLLNSGHAVIIGGDFNAQDNSWSPGRPNNRGRQLRAYIDRREDITVAAPNTPTYYPTRDTARASTLDFFLLSGIQHETSTHTVEDLSSDHNPVLLELIVTPTYGLPPARQRLRTDWTQYSETLAQQLTQFVPAITSDDLDRQAEEVTTAINTALAAASRPARPPPAKPPLPAHIREAITKRKRLRRIWGRTRHPITRNAFNIQCRRVKILLTDYRNATWESYLAGLELGDGSAWKTAKALRSEKPTIQPLHGQNGIVYTEVDKAEAFADTMEEQFRPHADIYDDDHIEDVEHFLHGYFSREPEDEIQPFTPTEVSAVVKRSKPRKAPGMDGISPRALQEAPYILIMCLVEVFNAVIRLHHFPNAWKVAKVVLFPKPGKHKLFPQNYRPISLLPVISKLFERLLLTRLSPLLEDVIRPEQFGFRRGHSSTQQLTRTVNSLVDNANMNLCSVAVLLDVSKAFDKVWHDGLLYKLTATPLPQAAVHLIRSYLTGRTFRTSVGRELSTTRPIEAGVPQGSVLGPVLYLIYTNDMPTVPRVSLSLYADDALYLTRSARPQLARNAMQRQLDALSPWLEKWRVAVNADKSNAVCFRKRRKMPRELPEPPSLDGEVINWTPQAKYLGITLDSKLNFAPHAKAKLLEAKRLQGFLSPLLGRRSSLPPRTKVTMFHMLVRSVIMYASTVWWAICAKTHKKNLEIVQNKFLRGVAKQPWYVRNETIRRGMQVSTFDEFARTSAEKFFASARVSDKAHIRDIALRYNMPEDYRPRPAAILDQPP